jgi:hypothetical protein
MRRLLEDYELFVKRLICKNILYSGVLFLNLVPLVFMFLEFANKYFKVRAEYGESSENGLWLFDG